MFNFNSRKAIKALAVGFSLMLCFPLAAQRKAKATVSVASPLITDEELDKFYSELIKRTIIDTAVRANQYRVLAVDKDRQAEIEEILRRQRFGGATKGSEIREDQQQLGEEYFISSNLALYGEDFVINFQITNLVTAQILKSVNKKLENVTKGTNNPLNTAEVKLSTEKATNELLTSIKGDTDGRFVHLAEDIGEMFMDFDANGAWNRLKKEGYTIEADTSRIKEPVGNEFSGRRLLLEGSIRFNLINAQGTVVKSKNMEFERKSILDISLLEREIKDQVKANMSDVIRQLVR